MNQFLKPREFRPAEPARYRIFDPLCFTALLVAAEVALIVMCAVATGVGYHIVSYRQVGEVFDYVTVGMLTAMLFTAPMLLRNELKIQDYINGRRSHAHTFMAWNYALFCLAFVGFATKTTGEFSRGWLGVFYVTGLVALVGLDAAVGRLVVTALARWRMIARRVMLIGSEIDIGRVAGEIDRSNAGFRVVATARLDLADPAGMLGHAVDKARLEGVDDVVILTDWSRDDLIRKIADAFSVLPVSVHLGASSAIANFSDARWGHFGAARALSLTEPPLTPVQAAVKRAFDFVLAGLALIALAPVFAVIAVLIKWDSAGPVFFRQRRRGYNLVEFRIWKFRTMTTLDDGDLIKQAMPGDVRVTRVGRLLRRYNLDEIPQLLNVVTGDMSLVGPRPHAVSHDQWFETRIAKYRRRLNVRPGITGWAQVNGLRGPTETEDLMRARVEYDLFYIDNWSILFDIYLMAATVLSPKAFRNAH